MATKETRRAVFLDRDGTLNIDAGYTHRVEDLCLIEGAVEGLAILRDLGLPLIVVTNQSGIARGYFSEEQMHAFNRHLGERLAAHGIELSAFYFCPSLPDAPLAAYRADSIFRKPRPGMLLQAAGEHGLDLAGSYMIGDKSIDVEAGRAAGCTTILVTREAAADSAGADCVATDLRQAASYVAQREALRGT